MTMIKYIEGRYEVQDRWRPESFVIECDCGERACLTSSATVCLWCGADHASTLREELAARQPGDEVALPWRYAGDREDTGIPC